jgi:phosphoserine aminotransferase
MSVMEVSHRGKAFMQVAAEAEADLRELMSIPANYRVLFMQGGASAQFSFVPMNLAAAVAHGRLREHRTLVAQGIAEARRYCRCTWPAMPAAPTRGCRRRASSVERRRCAYVHYTPNETISGVEFGYVPETGGVPLVADMSSSILSRPIDVSKFGLIYAGRAEEHRSLRAGGGDRARGSHRPRASRDAAGVRLQGGGRRALHAEHAADLRLVHGRPGVQMAERQRRRGGHGRAQPRQGAALYAAIDASHFYRNHGGRGFALLDERDLHLRKPELDARFPRAGRGARVCKNLKGHRVLGGMRASLYNAMPLAGVEALIAFMREFERRHA